MTYELNSWPCGVGGLPGVGERPWRSKTTGASPALSLFPTSTCEKDKALAGGKPPIYDL